jgi:hypothetical protein
MGINELSREYMKRIFAFIFLNITIAIDERFLGV